MKPKGVTTQRKSLDEYFLMVVFTLLLNRIYVFVNYMFWTEEQGSELRVKIHPLDSDVELQKVVLECDDNKQNGAE